MSDDLISRQAAIDTLNIGAGLLRRVLDDTNIVGAEREKYEWGLGLIESYISDMKELPSAQRKGKWIATQEWSGRNYSCSCCRYSFMVDTCMLKPMWNFCPNCGARMMKGESDE